MARDVTASADRQEPVWELQLFVGPRLDHNGWCGALRRNAWNMTGAAGRIAMCWKCDKLPS
jgi:hypothetical protein